MKFPASILMAALLCAAALVPAAFAADESLITGKVVETMDSGGYSYVCLEKDGNKTWVAVPQMKVTKGKTMSFKPGSEMPNFESRSLNRTFDKIIFSEGPANGSKGSDKATSKKEIDHDIITGKVVETMDSSGYSYVCVEKDGKKTWVAVPQMKITKGKTMSFLPGTEMTKFESKSLNRTFDRIIFSEGPVGSAPKSSGAAAAKAQVSTSAEKISVEKASAANAYTVAELYAKKKSLSGKEVVVRGKVVKFSQQIMGMNWVHIQDGTGNSAKGTHNMVATTKETAQVGDIVTVTGKLIKDKDFGFGYKYDLVVEEASISK